MDLFLQLIFLHNLKFYFKKMLLIKHKTGIKLFIFILSVFYVNIEDYS